MKRTQKKSNKKSGKKRNKVSLLLLEETCTDIVVGHKVPGQDKDE